MKLHQRLFWLFLLLLPTQLGYHFWPEFAFLFGIRVDYLAPTIYLTDILVGGILASWIWEEVEIGNWSASWRMKIGNWWREHWYLAAIFLYFFLTSLAAQNQGAALWKFLKIAEFFFLGFYVAKTKPFALCPLPLAIGLIYESFIAWFQFLKQASGSGILWWLGERTFTAGTPGIALGEFWGRLFLRAYGTFPHPNSLAGFFLVSLVLIWGLRGNLPTWFKVSVAVLGFLTLLISFSQAAWFVGVVVGLMVLGLRLLGKTQRFLTPHLLFLAIFVFLLGLFFSLLGLPDQAAQERVQLMKVVSQMVSVSPLIGFGLNNFLVQLPRFWSEGGIYFLQPVHNIFLLVAAETGLVGLIIFLWLFWLTFKKTILHKESALFFSLLVIFLTGLVDHYWYTLQQNQLLAAIVFGLAWGKTALNRVK